MTDWEISQRSRCDTSTKAIHSEYALGIFARTLSTISSDNEIRDIDIRKLLKIFTNILGEQNITDEEIELLQSICNNQNFENAYTHIVQNTCFGPMSILEWDNLKEKIAFSRIKIMITKLIIKWRVITFINQPTENNSNFISVDIPEGETYKNLKFLMLDGIVYEDIGGGILKTTLDENPKIFIKTSESLEEIVWINDVASITYAENNIKWLQDMILLYKGTHRIGSMSTLYSTKTKKVLQFKWDWTFFRRNKHGELLLDYKQRPSATDSVFESMLIDPLELKVIAHNTLKSFEFHGIEYFIHGTDGLICEIKNGKNNLVLRLPRIKLSALQIDTEKWEISYGWYFGIWKRVISLQSPTMELL